LKEIAQAIEYLVDHPEGGNTEVRACFLTFDGKIAFSGQQSENRE